MARIPFTLETWLKDKSQKVETRDGRIVHNIWPVKEPPIVNGKSVEVCALIDGEEDALVFFTGGKYLPVNTESPFDLFFVTPEEEMTEFEKAVGLVFTDAQLIPRDKDGIANIHDINEFIKKKAAELLALAKKELQLEIDAEIEKAYKTQDNVVFQKGLVQGVANTLKDLPRWKQIKDCDTTVRKPHIGTNMIGEKMLYIGNNCISISKIMKLPGFNS